MSSRDALNPKPHAILLAAGASSRMGRPKPLLQLGGRPLIALHLAALAPYTATRIVVTGHRAEEVRAALAATAQPVHNEHWASSDPLASLRVGLAAVDAARCCLVMPIDIAVPRPETLSALMDAGSGVPVDPQGRPGHPVLVPPHVLRAVLAAPKQGGLRAYLDDLPRVHVADPLVALDFDNPAAWAAYRAAWEEGNG